MNKRKWAASAAVLTVLILITGCGLQNNGDPAYFISQLTETTWETTYQGTALKLTFQSEGTGTLQYGDEGTVDFTYEVSKVTDDGTQARINVSADEGKYSDKIRGEYRAVFKDNKNLYLGSGMLGVTFAPSEDDFQ